jgi:hypothetical protein
MSEPVHYVIEKRSWKEVFWMSRVSPSLKLALVGVASAIAALFLGGCPWGP